MSEELREKIAAIVAERMFGVDVRAKRQYEVADSILAIPEIAEAQATIRLQAKRIMELSSEAVDNRRKEIGR